MKNDYKLLDFISTKGVDVITPLRADSDSMVCCTAIADLNDYELLYVHKNIFKMPISAYDKKSLKRLAVQELNIEALNYINDTQCNMSQKQANTSTFKIAVLIVCIAYIIVTMAII